MNKMAKSKFIHTIIERGYLHQCTNIDELDERCSKESLIGYIGFDCTADSLHVGSLTQIMMLRIFQNCGHKPIILMGGGTTKIGDPSGKDEARPLLSHEEIEKNKTKLKIIFEKFLKFGDGVNDAIMVDNNDWLDQLNLISFLREYGKHFSVNKLLSMDSVKQRLEREQPLSFLEFNYAILQAFDFLELSQKYNCFLQMGGSDQWGNIVTGSELIRKFQKKEAFGLTSPLITTSSGLKMGKTNKGAIWLNKEKLHVWEFWQYWRNTDDQDVDLFLKLFTELPYSEIKKLSSLKGSEINEAKIILANEVTSLCHDKVSAEKAMKTAKETFNQKNIGSELPSYQVSFSNSKSITLIDALCISNLCQSKSAARRLIRGGGAKINNQPFLNENHIIHIEDFGANKSMKLSSGKKNHAVLYL
tara:strand:+ start:352 stop:1602 length:1251 start_codon:yes stop_codon:yes gene_type:complete